MLLLLATLKTSRSSLSTSSVEGTLLLLLLRSGEGDGAVSAAAADKVAEGESRSF
jgi:hypothetical protein